MKNSLFLILICTLTTSTLFAQKKGKVRAKKFLKTYFQTIDNNDFSKWKSMVDVTTLNWGTRDSLPWVKLPGTVINPKTAESAWETVLTDFRAQDLVPSSFEAITLERGLQANTFVAFIKLKPGYSIDSRLPGDVFQNVRHSDLTEKAQKYIMFETFKMVQKDPTMIKRFFSVNLRKKDDGNLMVIHDDNPLPLKAGR